MRKFGRLTSKPNCRLNSWLDRFLDRMSKPHTDGKVDSGCSRASLLRLREGSRASLITFWVAVALVLLIFLFPQLVASVFAGWTYE